MTSVKRRSPFHEAKPRTPRGEARQREIKTMREIEKLSNIRDEDEYRSTLAELYEIVPGHPRYEKAMAAWRKLQRERL
jgi:hypothetical protein